MPVLKTYKNGVWTEVFGIPEHTSDELILTHNTSTTAHADIREEISELSATKADKSQGFFYIEGDSSSTTDTTNKVATWIGSHNEITEYFNGLTILYKVVTDGSTSTTLNINNLGAVTVVRNATTGISTACPVDGVLLLTYTVDSNGTAYWKTADYDANTKNTAGTSNKTGTKLFLVGGASQSSSGVTTYSNSNVYINTSNQLYSAKGFSGNLTGNADTATKATQDASGNVITDTYETKQDADAKFSQLLKTTVQTLTEEQKAQVRENIDAVGSIDIPVKGRDYWTEADQEAIVQQVIAALGTPVFGTVDLDNNIILSGALADGTYTIKYEDADGNLTEIGTIEVGGGYTNQIPISTDADGTIYNGIGYKANTRYSSSSGTDITHNGCYVTGYIPVTINTVICIADMTMDKNSADGNMCFAYLFDTNKANAKKIQVNTDGAYTFDGLGAVWDNNGYLTQFTAPADGFVRLQASYIGADSVITLE